jgi:ribonuclease P protein component
MRQTFRKYERLNSRKLIELLFNEGKSFFQYPFRVAFIEIESTARSPVQVIITVSKRNFSKATTRNKLKRLIRESFRKNKIRLYQSRKSSDKQLLIGLVYTANTILSYSDIEKKIILILQRLIEQDEQAAG